MEKKIIEMAARQKQPLPERIAKAPQLHLGLELFYQGFMDLNDERQIGMAEGPIPWRAMSEYCEAYEIYDEQREDFFHFVKILDATYLKHNRDKAEKAASKGK